MAKELSRLSADLERKQDNSFLKAVSAEDFLEHLEIANVNPIKPNVYQFSCPFSGHTHGDEHPSAIFNDGKHEFPTAWRCYGCHRVGNAISFLAEHEGISRTKARNWLKEHYAANFSRPKGGLVEEFDKQLEKNHGSIENQAPVVLDWKQYQQFEVDWQWFFENELEAPEVAYMFKRGFTVANLNEWNIGFDYNSDRITIPVMDADGNLVGVKGRAWRLDHQPRYLVLGDKYDRKPRYGFSPYEKSKILFGLHRFGQQRRYVLDEGEINVMSFQIAGIPAFGTGSASMSDVQLGIIREFCDEVVLFLDNDESGERATWGTEDQRGIIDRLKDFVKVKIAPDHKHDANDLLKRGKVPELRRLVDSAEPWYIVERRRRQSTG